MNPRNAFRRQADLIEEDVRERGTPRFNPKAFLKEYTESNFPQTASQPSKMQLEGRVPMTEFELKSKKQNPNSGIGFDRPEVS